MSSYGRTCRYGHKVVGENARRCKEGWRCVKCQKRSNRVPTEPGDGVGCLLCGDVMRNLGTHLVSYHGITKKEYREQFPGAEVTGPIFKAIRSDIERDRAEEGTSMILKTRKAECKNGHPLKGSNVRIDKNGNRGCRTCMRDYYRRYDREKRKKETA